MSDSPPGTPPMGTDEGYTVAPRLLATVWSLAGITFFFLVARLYTRASIVGKVSADDYLLVISWILALMFAVILQIACNWGLGQHMWNLDLQHHIEAIKYNYISEPISIFSVMFGRISFSVTLLRLIGPHDKGKRWAIWFLIIEQILINISTVIIIFVQCGSHVTAMYNPVAREQPGVKCWSPNVQTYYSYFQSSVNVVTDLALTLLPIWLIWNMQLRLAMKISLVGLLGLSFFSMAATIVKTYELKNVSGADLTVGITNLYIWAALEGALVILAASIAALKPLYRKIAPGTSRDRYDSGAYQLSNQGKPSSHPNSHSRSHGSRRRGSALFATQPSAGTIGSSDVGTKVWDGQKWAFDQISERSESRTDKRGDSQEEIARHGQLPSGITKTTVVEIDRDTNEGSERDRRPERMV